MEYGAFFEHFIFMELTACLDCTRNRETLGYWRTTSNIEVDFIVGDKIAMAVKATRKTDAGACKDLIAFREEADCERCMLVCQEEQPRKLQNGIEIMPWRYFLSSLWSGGIVRNPW